MRFVINMTEIAERTRIIQFNRLYIKPVLVIAL